MEREEPDQSGRPWSETALTRAAEIRARHEQEIALVMANKRAALQVQLDGGLPALREYIDKLMREEQKK